MKHEAIKTPEIAPNSTIMDKDPTRLLIRNSMCRDCALFNKDCAGTRNPVWTGCISRTKPDGHYTINLNGRYYALAMDTFGHYVFGIGPDTGKLARIERTRGSTAGRDAAILATCTPFDTWREAYAIAKTAGYYCGELYTD